MDFKKLRIIFMGTPEFAVASLQALHEAGCDIVGVVTAPDKPAGRGLQLQQSAVKLYATQHGLRVLQPEKLKDPEFLKILAELKADLQIVVAFRMLPEVVWSMPPMGTVNVHGSLLPQYRGAAPINWAIINGETYTGVTTFRLKHEIDTGNILMQEKIAIDESDHAGSLHDKMKDVGARLLLKTLQGLANDTLKEIPQNNLVVANEPIHHAPKIHTNTCSINWNEPGKKIIQQIRGLSPYPTAFTFLDGKRLKIFAANFESNPNWEGAAGTWETDQKKILKYRCSDGWIQLNDIQLEGKKRMKTEDFLRGFKP